MKYGYDPSEYSARDRSEIERQMDGRHRRAHKSFAVHLAPLELVTHELRVVARTSVGLRAFESISWEAIDTSGCSNLVELAAKLRCGPEGEGRDISLPALLHISHQCRPLALTAFVAMRPALERTLSLIDPRGGDEEAGEDLVREFFVMVGPSSPLLHEFLTELHRRTRASVRRRRRKRERDREREVELETPHLDLVSGGDPADSTGDVLARLVACGVVSHDDAELLVRTHVLGESLSVIALESHVPYRTLQSQRLRAEAAIRGHLRRSGED